MTVGTLFAALDACRDWVDSLKPSRRPTGVVAGRVIEPRS